SQPWDAPDPLPVMRREMKLLLIEIGRVRTEGEQLRAKEEETQNVKEFLIRGIESRDQWQREAQRLPALMAKMPSRLPFCGRGLDAFKASREGSEGLDLHQSPLLRVPSTLSELCVHCLQVPRLHDHLLADQVDQTR